MFLKPIEMTNRREKWSMNNELKFKKKNKRKIGEITSKCMKEKDDDITKKNLKFKN